MMKARILYILCSIFFLFCWLSFLYLSSKYSWYCIQPILKDNIVEINPHSIDKKNNGRVVYFEGTLTSQELLRDDTYNVECKGAMLIRRVRRTQASTLVEEYHTQKKYAADYKNCKLGAFVLKNLNEDSLLPYPCIIKLKKDNIPNFLRARSFIEDGELYIKEEDGSTSIVSFLSIGADPRQHGQFLGRQKEDTIDLIYCTLGEHPAHPVECYNYQRRLKFSGGDICMRFGFVLSLGVITAYFCFFYIRKACGKKAPLSKKYALALLVLAILVTVYMFTSDMKCFLFDGIEELGFNLIQTNQWISYCDVIIMSCKIVFAVMCGYLIIDRARNADCSPR